MALLRQGCLTERDMHALVTVQQFGLISTSQIRRLVFHTFDNPISSKTVSRRRLNYLYQQYALDREFRGPHREMIYSLGILGARLLQMAHRTRSWQELRLPPRVLGERLLRLDLALAVTEFGVLIMEGLRPRQGTVQWYSTPIFSLSFNDQPPFEPDGAAQLTVGKQRLGFSLVWDAGDITLRELATRLWPYLMSLSQPDALPATLTHFPTLLIVTATVPRAESLLQFIAQPAQREQLDLERFRFLVTTTAHIERHGPLARVWSEAHRDEIGLTGRSLADYLR